jgi:selenide,water dikinase
VTGLVDPNRVISNAGASAGDHLLLTKPLGTGIVSTAIKRNLASNELAQKAAQVMASLNTAGAALASAGLTRAGTDVTGFGLLGHLSHLCRESNLTAQLNSQKVPAIDPEVVNFINQGCVPGGSRKNLELAKEFTKFADQIDEAGQILLADAQTSGGLLLAVNPDHLEQAHEILLSNGAHLVADIGVLSQPEEFAVIVS